MAHPSHLRVKILKRDARRLTKAVVHLVFLFCGGRRAKRGDRWAPEKLKSGGGNVKILLPGTKAQGIAGSGEQRGAAAGGPGSSNSAAEWRRC